MTEPKIDNAFQQQCIAKHIPSVSVYHQVTHIKADFNIY